MSPTFSLNSSLGLAGGKHDQKIVLSELNSVSEGWSSAANLTLIGVIFTLFCGKLHFTLNFKCNTLFEDKKV